ncbi:dienelactone hydrolase-like enzyme [Rheinheimera sp. A13L]|uniref:dienelactone hydrolase family protein n=1 Tax=Rheinheimera sp. A13L TaxID=506534 RepID=UPI000212567A|nr:dienelactone hydrolase family protein [Rheinheimera sp. A13L]EGM77746.1 dienelactone hydrolase-like enzyme [Rheinheimera sp. A13L]
MQLVITTDIFGAQPEVLLQFDQLGSDYLCVQPYDHQSPVFADDKEAYQYFLDHGGIETYCNKVGEVLKAQTEPVFLVGFSAGAAACWANLALEHLTVKACVGFYGGQIRQMTHLQPLYPTELIFAEESHFSVLELMDALAGKINLKQSFVPYPHGFMNVLSRGYQAEAAQIYWKKIKAGFLSSL